jgi:hypothetical protein
MKGKSFIKRSAYSYFILGCILLLGVVAFYLSCKSKSPTELSSPSSGTTAVRGASHAARTTTTSSVPAAIKSGKSQINTTTIITSRNLTTTSTTTTTTSIPTTTTSIREATTSIAIPELEWCTFAVMIPYIYVFYVNNGDRLDIPPSSQLPLIIIPSLKNIGGAPATNVRVTLKKVEGTGQYSIFNPSVKFPWIPNNGRCKDFPMPSSQLLKIQNNDSLGDFSISQLPAGLPILVLISLEQEGQKLKFRFTESYSNKLFVFTIRAVAP